MKNLETFEEFINESYVNEDARRTGMIKAAVQTALKNAGYKLKQSQFKVGVKKDGPFAYAVSLNGKYLGADDNWDDMIEKFTKYIKKDSAMYGLDESAIDESLNSDYVYGILDIAAQYTSDAADAASQTWDSVEDLVKYVKGDHIPKKYHSKFDQSVERFKTQHKIK